MQKVGAGPFDFKRILETAEQSGAADAVIERDDAKELYLALDTACGTGKH